MEGVVSQADSAAELRRTSVFPGLGWMMTRRLWEEIKPKWPDAYWDDWLRQPNQTRGRDCIYPAINRARTIGKIGSSEGQFFKKYLARIVLNEEDIDWSKEDLSVLDRDAYRKKLLAEVAAAKTVARGPELKQAQKVGKGDVRVFFSPGTYKRLADELGLMNDLKEGIPRSSFEGIVRLHTKKGFNLFLVPKSYRGTNGIPVKD
jgi:GNT-I family.